MISKRVLASLDSSTVRAYAVRSLMMHGGVACRTESNQILLGIIAGMAAEFSVMDFQVGHGPAHLASPAIALKDSPAELFIRFGIKPKARLSWTNAFHNAFSAT